MAMPILLDSPPLARRAPARIGLEIYRMGGRNPTGVHRYALSLASELAALAGDDAVEVWTARESDGSHRAHGAHVADWTLPRRPLHLAWAALHRPRADWFTGHMSLMHQLTNVVPLPTRAPLVVTVHDVMALQHPEWYAPRARWAFGRALRYAADHAARLIAPSERVRLDIEEWLGVERDRIRVVPEGVGRPFTQVIPAAAVRSAAQMFGVRPDHYFVTVGEVTARKNLPILFRALAALRGSAAALPLVVVGGDGIGAAQIHALADELGVGDLVRFTGRLPDPLLAAVVRGARALLHPSFYEGFGLTPLEAMAAGTPVIASSTGALPEVVGAAGSLASPYEPSEWASAMATAALDDESVAANVRAGAQRAAHFSWETAARHTWSVYEEVLAA